MDKMGVRFLAQSSATPGAARDAVPAASPAATRFHLSLRAKGAIVLAALVVYLAFVGLYLTHERAKLLQFVQQMDRVHSEHDLLTKVNTSLIHSIISLQALLSSGNIQGNKDDIALDIEAYASSLPELVASHPGLKQLVGRLQQDIAAFGQGRSLETLTALRDGERNLAEQLYKFRADTEDRGDMLSHNYRDLNQDISTSALAINLLALLVFGVTMASFFSKLTSDIKKLEARAVAIVAGYRGMPIEVTRSDELGSLMLAINWMQSELRIREVQHEISREQRFHQEKMAAVGSLAAAVAHEVSNPINSISGIAQHTIDSIRSHQRVDDGTLCRNAELTLKQTERIGSIVRQIADLSAPRSPDPELLDINELVHTTCSFVHYDNRFRHIELVPDTDRDIPAVRAVADHLTQVLMNLLINAADAMEKLVGRKPAIRVSTRRINGEIILSVHDNGQGIDPTVLAHAFEQSFTTKPAGKGRGIGLYLCKTLIEEIGGRIELQSTVGVGTTVQVRLPWQHAQIGAA